MDMPLCTHRPKEKRAFHGEKRAFHGEKRAFHGEKRAFHGEKRAFHGEKRAFHGEKRAFHGEKRAFHGEKRAGITSTPTIPHAYHGLLSGPPDITFANYYSMNLPMERAAQLVKNHRYLYDIISRMSIKLTIHQISSKRLWI
jgi:hypothetical protein